MDAPATPSNDLHDMAREGRLDVALATNRLHVESLALIDDEDKTVIEVADASGHGDQIPAALRAEYEAAHVPRPDRTDVILDAMDQVIDDAPRKMKWW